MTKTIDSRREMIRKLRFRLRVKDRSKGLFDYAFVPSNENAKESGGRALRRRAAIRRVKTLLQS
ncbi:MAG: hypothetical protein H8E66_08040 [Planctomycetes bacterium]|nr:hypothetical protein [Planctomycetota bacterium]